jgi:disulfide oxidoreductase YuzD
MKTWTVAAALLMCASAVAQNAPIARKSCDDLKAEITKKLDAKNVVGYSLDVVDKGKESSDAKIVGSCDGGTKNIVYSKSAPQPKATEEAKKQ